MADAMERPPRHNFSRQLRSAEEVVGSVVESILTDCGHMLWHKYLERKAFHFAAEAVTDAIESHLQMCFVAHDQGEDNLEDDWTLEEEPVPGEIDNWARMTVPVRRKPKEAADGSGAGGKKAGRGVDARQAKTRVSDLRNRLGKGGKAAAQPESRSSPILEDFVVDDEEDVLREQKLQEQKQNRECENKAKEQDRQKEELSRIVALRHEEMDRRAHTFDQDGNIIWIEEVNTLKLPKVQEVFPYGIKKDPKARDLDLSMQIKQKEAPKDKKEKNRGRGLGVVHKEPEFTDGFSKLQYGQPPILEIMTVRPGVQLESNGKAKGGPPGQDVPSGQMTRANYLALAEKEVGMDATFTSRAGDSSAQAGSNKDAGSPATVDASPGASPGPPSGRGGGGSTAVPGETAVRSAPGEDNSASGGGGGGTKLPPVAGSKAGAAGAAAAAVGGSRRGAKGVDAARSRGLPDPANTSSEDKLWQPAPTPPNPAYRAKRHEALGHLAYMGPPRYHMPRLGGQPGFGREPQPPLGATMGHGLVRTGSEAFYFPDPTPLPQSPMGRAVSEGQLPKLRAQSSGTPQSVGGRRGFSGDMIEKDDPRAGKIIGDPKSSVYQSLKRMLGDSAGVAN